MAVDSEPPVQTPDDKTGTTDAGNQQATQANMPTPQATPMAPPPPAAPTNTGPDLQSLVTEIQAIPERITDALKAFNPPPPVVPEPETKAETSTTDTTPGSDQSATPVSFGDKFRKMWFG